MLVLIGISGVGLSDLLCCDEVRRGAMRCDEITILLAVSPELGLEF